MSILFETKTLGNMSLKNAIIHSATYECMADENGMVTQPLVDRYKRIAEGGVGLIIPGYLYVQRSGKAAYRQAGINEDAHIPGLMRLVDGAHEHGAKVVFQLAHAGRQTSSDFTGTHPMGPSPDKRDQVYLVKPKPMSEVDIAKTVAAFAAAAGRSVEAGADGIQIHAAHGYLVGQFLSPLFNRRTDRWGGSEENRFRLFEEIYQAIKACVPADFPILVKLNVSDYAPSGGNTPETTARILQKMEARGVTAVELSGGTIIHSFLNTCRGEVPVEEMAAGAPWWMRPFAKLALKRMRGKFDFEEAYHLPAAKIATQTVSSMPIILVGGMRTVKGMEAVIEGGVADFVSLSRPFVREPSLVNRLRSGRATAVSCTSCNKCMAAMTMKTPIKCRAKNVGSTTTNAGSARLDTEHVKQF